MPEPKPEDLFNDGDEWVRLSFQEKVDLIKSCVTLPELVSHLGFDLDSRNKIRPPWNTQERTASCHVYDDHFYDYASGRHGDIIDFLVAFEQHEGRFDASPSETVRNIRKVLLRAGKQPGDADPIPPRQVVDHTGQFLTSGVPVHSLVGLPAPHVRQMPNGDLLVPHMELSASHVWRVYGVKVRHTDGSKSAWPGSQFTHRLFSPEAWNQVPGFDEVVICEGETDAYAMLASFDGDVADVLALPSGSSCWKDHWLKDLEPYERIWLCMDNDRAGKQALDKLHRKIGFARAKELKVPALFNDAREAIAAGWSPAETISAV